jgi:hypothetical protein
MTHFRFSDRVCAVCASPAVGWGYARNARTVEQIAFCCDDKECLDIASRTYAMREIEFRRLDQLATEEGGASAGKYLDEIGKSNLAQLTEFEWQEFCRRMIGGYRHALKTKLRDEAPF